MKDIHYKASILNLDASVPNMNNWSIVKLIRHYKCTRSLRNEEAVFSELLRRGKTRQEINDLLTD